MFINKPTFFKLNLKRTGLIYILILFFLPLSVVSDSNNTKKIQIKNNDIKWHKVTNNKEHENKSSIEWEKLEINKSVPSNKNYNFVPSNSNIEISPKIRSFNRSIVFENEFIGPDLTFLVPIGFKSSDMMNLDFSVRGWNRRPKNSKFFAWNNGDAVGQIFINAIKNYKSSIGLSLGARSLFSGSGVAGGTTPVGEGFSAGFRWDYQINEKTGIAFGAEQLIHFDDKTDTGRDIYLTYSRAFLDDGSKRKFPFVVLTGGIGTGYLGLWEETKFACSDLFGGAGIDINKYNQLCWGPFGAASFVFNEKFSSFIEYNNYSIMLGSSYSLLDKLRLTFGATIAEFYDDYELKNSDNLRWFSRVSLGF